MFVNATHLATAQMHKAYDRRIDLFSFCFDWTTNEWQQHGFEECMK